ncbi:MAG: LysR family transcriptional regulator [Flavobacteriaceae bacterium]|nr:LysR family transcriptional regulator [Flavobacteriaceae bacterium]
MKYQLDCRQLRYFVAVARHLNFRKAADSLFITQPGLSRQIKQLEAGLGTVLFERSSRVVQLTQAGKFLLEEAQQLFLQMEQLEQNIRLLGAGLKGEFRIGFVGSAMQQVIPKFLLAIDSHFKEVRVSLKEMSISDQVKALQNNQIDLAYVRLSKPPENMALETVFEDTFSVVLPEQHAMNLESFRHIGQLKNEKFIMFSSDYSPLYYDKIMSICKDRGFEPQISHKSVHAQTIFKLVEAGLGVSIVPSALQYGYNLKVKFLPLHNIRQKARLGVMWRKDNKNLLLEHLLPHALSS